MTDAEVVRRGRALRGIRQSAGFAELEALIARKKQELFERWASSKGENALTKDWCDGYLALADEIVRDVDDMIYQAGQKDPLLSKEAAKATGGAALGRGELAT